jgi:hypothetical protein
VSEVRDEVIKRMCDAMQELLVPKTRTIEIGDPLITVDDNGFGAGAKINFEPFARAALSVFDANVADDTMREFITEAGWW